MTEQLSIQINDLLGNQPTVEKWEEDLIDAEYGFSPLVVDSIRWDLAGKKVSFEVRRPFWELPVEQMERNSFPRSLFEKYRVPCVVSLVEISPVENFERVEWPFCPGLDVAFEGNSFSIGEGDAKVGFSVALTKATKLLMRDAGQIASDHVYNFGEARIKKMRQRIESLTLNR